MKINYVFVSCSCWKRVSTLNGIVSLRIVSRSCSGFGSKGFTVTKERERERERERARARGHMLRIVSKRNKHRDKTRHHFGAATANKQK